MQGPYGEARQPSQISLLNPQPTPIAELKQRPKPNHASSSPAPLPPHKVYMYFVKCWADGMPQPDLVNTLPGPPLRNSRHWMIRSTEDQWSRNQEYNKQHSKQVVPLGMLVRPWATQYSVPGFKNSDWPPGSSSYIKDKANKKC